MKNGLRMTEKTPLLFMTDEWMTKGWEFSMTDKGGFA
jgi:hypothetical protein